MLRFPFLLFCEYLKHLLEEYLRLIGLPNHYFFFSIFIFEMTVISCTLDRFFCYGNSTNIPIKTLVILGYSSYGLKQIFFMLLLMVFEIHIDYLLQELNSDWQRAATSLLVAIGSHLPDLVSYFFFFELLKII